MTTATETRQQVASRAAAWLVDHGHTVSGTCTLHIYKGTPNHDSLVAVKYRTPDRGEQPRYYVLGYRPDVKRPNRTCYVIDGKVFFVATYTEEKNEFSPFGPAFVLCEWTSSDPIDNDGDARCKPYDRVPLVESKYMLSNLSMERALVNGECRDVSACDRTPAGDYILRDEVRAIVIEQDTRNRGDTDFCDANTESWIGSIGLHRDSQVVLAATSGKFYQHSEYDCLFLR